MRILEPVIKVDFASMCQVFSCILQEFDFSLELVIHVQHSDAFYFIFDFCNAFILLKI